uniref:Uncharacterized protein n=1 Tax=viral metagenome TaxID=1070528 RepID=A0A6H1ZPA6_9ZZZZ
MEINEYILKIIGSSNLDSGLEQGKRYLIEVEADVYDITQRDNQDNTINEIYKARMTGNTKILDNGKVIIKAEKKGTRSQKLHGAIWINWNMQGLTEDFDQYYEKQMIKITTYLPEIINFLEMRN